ncbi:peptidyl-alpha-hydroxyglycine alpha-amidating lyase family protein [Qipengyuania sphaerica]|uniref:peptidyl-alpha-hydroxyglycine alpha-amidating lyase family protein n=1 Tax=Qipengyuania sphaerica TaxID=2867243 RepID=UPI001C87E5E0|nr:peptidyl-alpha-hydroxyglycine alpha-amidating lyase family protein [Qipengyuania sphaerica]MBX7540234.1 peptidyl-alpha-hydroxyglycine alpha-amidating lyase family protein [Qipengyuania sphaerica]
MRRLTCALLGLTLASCSGGQPAREEAPRLDFDENWPDIPDDAVFGEPSAVDVDSHGHIFVLHRAGRAWEESFSAEPIEEPTVFMFAANGKLLGKWGAGAFIMPHGLSVDEDNNVWITDVGREQVFRFSHEGAQQLVLGERGVAGQDGKHFGRPADVAFSQGRVLVADGYVNTRVAVFDREGNFITQWGEPGDGAGEFDLPHAISADAEHIYVADRENARVQVLSLDGEPRGELRAKQSGHPYSAKPIGSGYVLVIEGRDMLDRQGAIGRIYRPDGELERVFDAGVDPRTGTSLGHDIAIGRDGSVYMVDNKAGRVIKFELARAGLEQE